MKDQFLEPNSGKYLTLYRAVADANPAFTVGSSAAEMFQIQAIYTSGAQTLARVDFVETSTLATIWRFVVGTSAGDDWTIYDGTNNIVLVEGDTTRVTIALDSGANSDFIINDGTDDIVLIQSDLGAFTFEGDGTAGSDFNVSDGTTDMLLIQTDDDTVDIVGHDASAKGLMLGGTLVTSTADELNAIADVSARIVTHVATGAITAATHADRINLLGEVGGDAEVVLTLPAATGTGNRYKFYVSVVNTSNYKIQVVGNDTMDGHMTTLADADDTIDGWETASDSDTITLNATTTGGVAIGDWLELVDIATDQWAVTGLVTSSGTEATPFSAAVS